MSEGRRNIISLLIFALLLSLPSLISSCKVLELDIGVPTEVASHISATPTPTWKVFDTFEEGVSIALPPEWETLDASLPDINEALIAFSEKNPDLMSRSGASIESIIETGLIFIAVDASNEAMQMEFSGSANLGMVEVGSNLTLDDVVGIVTQNLDEVSNIASDLEERRLDTRTGKSVELHYSTEYILPDDSVIAAETFQYLYLKDGTLYILTFAASPDHIDGYLPVFTRVANELSLGYKQVSHVIATTTPTQKHGTPTYTSPPQASWTPSFEATLTPTATSSTPTSVNTMIPRGNSRNVQRVIKELKGHIGVVDSIAWSPAGSILATGDGISMARFWDPETWYQISSFEGYEEGGAFHSISWSPDGTRIAGALMDFSVGVWDVDTGDRGEYVTGYDGRNTFYSTNSLTWSPNGMYLAWGGLDDSVWIWDLDETFKTLKVQDQSVYAVAWSPDGKFIGSSGYSGGVYDTVTVWDVESEEIVLELEGHSNGVQSIAWSPDMNVIATSDGIGRIMLWEADTGLRIRILTSHDGWVYNIAWSPDGSTFVSLLLVPR
jgi:WD40 repeat protein